MSRFSVFATSLALFAALAAACSSSTTVVQQQPAADSGTPAEDAGADSGEPVAFALTSTSITQGGTIPAEFTCKGANVSPPLSWTAGPEGTKSYAIVFTDTDNGLTHAVIYDIPAATTSLPKGVENAYQPANVQGAKQTASYKPTVFGYAGPCPSAKHVYEWALYAIDVETLPGMTQSTTGKAAATEILKHDLAVVKLTASFTP